MKFGEKLVEGILLSRPNRFLGIVKVGRKRLEAFIPNPGRMDELLFEGASVLVRKRRKADADEERRTTHDVVLAKKGRTSVSIDSRLPNALVAEAIRAGSIGAFKGYRIERPEFCILGSRFDLLLKGRRGEMLVEAKSCTLVEDGRALFPDAPTERGARHMKTLVDAMRRGYKAAVIFIIQRGDARSFSPNDPVDPIFGQAVRIAAARGVEVMAYKCKVSRSDITIDGKVPVRF